jgi:hypothetical protein
MVTTFHRTKAVVILAAAVLAICVGLLVASAPPANADSPYCGGDVGAHGTCYGAARWMNALYGSGNQHSVCIGTTNYTGTTCSSGPGQGTYNPLGSGNEYGQPWILNQGWSVNRVYGYTYG